MYIQSFLDRIASSAMSSPNNPNNPNNSGIPPAPASRIPTAHIAEAILVPFDITSHRAGRSAPTSASYAYYKGERQSRWEAGLPDPGEV